MLALRPTMVPIVGESTDDLFIGQVEIEGWSWDFHNLEEMTRIANDPDRRAYKKRQNELSEADSKRTGAVFDKKLDDLKRQFDSLDVSRLQKEMDQENERLKRLPKVEDADRERYNELANEQFAAMRRLKKAMEVTSDADDARRRAEKAREDDRSEQEEEITNAKQALEEYKSKNFQFKFSKRVDAATTQLLNCMKAGDLLPTVTLTMHQASSNTPWSLVITVTKMRLLKYDLKVEVSDTMTDMREDWEAEFASFGYVYQNRPHAGLKSLTAGHANTAVARGMTQATVRTFLTKNMDFF
jgi:type VI protein secretion system component Hcp